jgi:hypothetical protein
VPLRERMSQKIVTPYLSMSATELRVLGFKNADRCNKDVMKDFIMIERTITFFIS